MTKNPSVIPILVAVAALFAAPQRAAAQSTGTSASAATSSGDSAVYAAFFETLNRDARRDTLHVEEMSKIFVKLPAHYDTTAPGLNAALAKISKEQRPSTDLHLPSPIQVIPHNMAVRLAGSDLLGELGAVPGRPQGTTGLWSFTPVVYSADGTDAMFSYLEICGRNCGEDVVVWLRKNAASKWEVRRTAILTIE
jgi:hypothetical protein